jgi:hypothetical protein
MPEELEAGPEEAEGEEGPLLATPGGEGPEAPAGEAGEEAPPGKRDEYGRVSTTTSRSKGKRYSPVKMDRRTGGKQSFLAMGGNQYTGTSTRSYLPGASDINSLYRFSENQDANYHDRQEKEIFQENIEIKKLIDSLKEAENPTDETQTQ